MKRYILSYDKFQNANDPFDDIVKLLLKQGAVEIKSPVQSTFSFEMNQKVCEYEMCIVLKRLLEKLCYFCLGECCFIHYAENDDSKPSRKERIELITNKFKNEKN